MKSFLLLLILFFCAATITAQMPGAPTFFMKKKVPSGGVIPGNTYCEGAIISMTPCSAVAGASINDDVGTAEGIEYNWPNAFGYVAGNQTSVLVEIGGQCWYRRNAITIPTNFDPVPTWVNNNDVGWSGYYTGGPFTNEGRLYQFSAAMNGSTDERAQGVCAPGWHVPSDCEYMFLENTLGMSVAHQEDTGFRGFIADKLTDYTENWPTNSSGFTILHTGIRHSGTGVYQGRETATYLLSSSGGGGHPSAGHRSVQYYGTWGVYRYPAASSSVAASLRCLKD